MSRNVTPRLRTVAAGSVLAVVIALLPALSDMGGARAAAAVEPVKLAEPELVRSSGADLAWTAARVPEGSTFARYEVHRARMAGFTPSATTLVAQLQAAAVTRYSDTTAAAATDFYYRIVSVIRTGDADQRVPSDELRVRTVAKGTAQLTLRPAQQGGQTTQLTRVERSADECDDARNFGAAPAMKVGSEPDRVHRGLLKFDLRRVPAAASVTKAELALPYAAEPANRPEIIDVRRVTRAWTEGGGNAEGVCNGSGASWAEAKGGVGWSTAGGDTAPAPIGVIPAVLPSSGSAERSADRVDLTAAVSQWVRGRYPNHGLLLRARTENPAAPGAQLVSYGTDDAADPELRPELRVTYTDGNAPLGPRALVTSPVEGARVRGTVPVTAAATDDGRVDKVELLADGRVFGADEQAPYESKLDTSTLGNGTHKLTARATDDAGNVTTSAEVAVTVENSAAPGLRVIAPAAGATVSGQVPITVAASDDVGVRTVEVLVDGVAVGEDDTAPYSVPWDTQDPIDVWTDARHTITARVTDTSGQSTVTASGTEVTVQNDKRGEHDATLELGRPGDPSDDAFPARLPESTGPRIAVHDPYPRAGGSVRSLTSAPLATPASSATAAGACGRTAYCPEVAITNTGKQSLAGARTQLWFRWYAANGTVLHEGLVPGALPVRLPPGQRTSVRPAITPPKLPPGAESGRYRLRLDLYDTATRTWFAAAGNRPLDVPVQVTDKDERLGLEKFWTYEGEATGAGSSAYTNIANGNLLWRWSPWNAPGRGLATILDITYNSLEDHSGSPLGNNFSLAISGLTRLGTPLDLHNPLSGAGAGASTSTSSGAIEFTDGDGTVHRFTRGRDGTWNRPPGVHLFLRQVSEDKRNPKFWAFSRPDAITFYYDRDGFPTFVRDRNGNEIAFVLAETPPGEDPGGPRKRVVKVVDPGGRAFEITYWSKADTKKPHVRGKIKRITDHTGSALDFDYYDDGNLLRIIQRGGFGDDGGYTPDRSFVFTYTDSSGARFAIPDAADRLNPDPHTPNQSVRLASIRDPRAGETQFTYYGPGDDGKLRWKLKTRRNRTGDATGFGYDIDARETVVRAPLNRTTRYRFDRDGKATTVVNALGQATVYTWSDDFHVTRITEPNTATTSFDYNDAGYLETKSDQLGNTIKLEYEARPLDGTDTGKHFLLLKKVTDPEGVASAAAGDFESTFGYDAAGNVATQTDPEGNTSRYEWNGPGTDAPGTLRKSIDPRGNATEMLDYEANGFPQRVVDAEGGVARFGYTPDGLTRFSQSPLHEHHTGAPDLRSYRTYTDYDAFHRAVRTSTPKRTDTERGLLVWSGSDYDANDNTVLQRNPVYGYGDPGTGPLTETEFDPMDRQLTVLGPDRQAQGGERVELAYDAAGRKVSETTPNGVATSAPGDYTTLVNYDPLDRPVRLTRTGQAGERARTSWTCYDEVGNKVASVAPKAALTGGAACPVAPGSPYSRLFQYDRAHRLLKTIDPLGRTTTTTYNRNGWEVSTTDEAGKVTTQKFDQRGLVLEQTMPFDGNRRLTSRREYDEAGNVIKEITPRAVEKGTTTDYVKEYRYDRLNRVVRTTLPKDGGTGQAYEHVDYDAESRLLTKTLPVADPEIGTVGPNAKSSYRYYDTGWVATSDDPGNPQVLFDYTPEGWQSERTPRTRDDNASALDTDQTMIWSYFADGKPASRTDPGGQPATYAYDRNNNLVEATISSGVVDPGERTIVTRNSFNGFDELVRSGQTKLADDEAEQVDDFTTYDYDLNGNLTFRGDEGKAGAQTAPVKRNVFGYDPADQLTTQFELGRDTSCAGDRRIRTTWTPQGWLDRRTMATATDSCAEEQSGAEAAWRITQDETKEYFDNSQLRQLLIKNGAGEIRESHQVSYDQDGAYTGQKTRDVFRLIGPDAGKPCDAEACTATWAFDARDRVTRHTDGHGGEYTYTLDEPDRQADAGVRAGNVTTEKGPKGTTTRSYTGNQMTETTAEGQTTKHWYDSLGRVDCITTAQGTQADCSPSSRRVAANLVTDYTYDYLDRLESTRSYAGGRAVDESVYQNDALDRVVAQTEKHQQTGMKSKRTDFAYLGPSNNVVAETQTSPDRRSAKHYSYDAYGSRLRMVDESSARSGDGWAQPEVTSVTYAHDTHASVSLLLHDSGAKQGDAKAAYAYTPYGELDKELSAGDTDEVDQFNPFRYTDKRHDTGSGTLDMGARRYDPQTTRFLQQDVFKAALADMGLTLDPLSQNRYALGGGNPTSNIEVDGHMLIADGGGGGSVPSNPGSPSETPGQQYDGPSREDVEKAKQTDREFDWGKALLEAGLDFLGINDIKDCVTKGDLGACAWAVGGFIPWGKAGKIIKGGRRIFKMYSDWKGARAWADDVLKRADEATERAKQAATKTDDAAKNTADDVAQGTENTAKQADEAVSCPINSFTRGTPVLMADGSHKPIEDVELGDLVLATDPETGQTEARPVVALITGTGEKDLVQVTVDTDGAVGDATGTIAATAGHPFWVEDAGRWIDAGDLEPGDEIRTPDGDLLPVVGTFESSTPHSRVHNLTVDGIHTYYVQAGSSDVLVHNSCGKASSAESARQRADEVHGALDPVAKRKRTTAVVRAQRPDGSHVSVVAGSGRGLSRQQKAMLGADEIAAPGVGKHAEVTALEYIAAQGWSPIAGGTSRNVCTRVCAPALTESGASLIGSTMAGRGTGKRKFIW